jgi:hypothetical protein
MATLTSAQVSALTPFAGKNESKFTSGNLFTTTNLVKTNAPLLKK